MCKGGGGQNTTTTTQSGPPAQVLQNYQDVYNQAKGVAASNAGAQPYPGETVAPLAYGQDWATQNAWAPSNAWGQYGNAAQSYYGQATAPIWDQSTSSAFGPGNAVPYLSPYIQNVVDTTQASFNNQNQIQNQGIVGNAIASGAWGGDRAGVAQGIAAGHEQLAQAPVIAGLYNQGYQTAQGTAMQAAQAQLGANEANRWLASQAAAGENNLGQTISGLTQTDLSNALTTGQLQQSQAQANLNVPYANWLRQTSYPYQATSWLANIAEGTGSLSGGTGSTTVPGPSTASQIAGLGIGGLGLLGSTGAFSGLTSPGSIFGPSVPQAVDAAGNAIPTADVLSAFAGSRRGGRIHYGIGGPTPPMGSTIPDLSISMVPAINPASVGKGPNFLSQPATSQTTQSGGGGGGGI